ncbi:MAG: hypothetical protein KGO53_09205 [Alphaproteobacteria bacterium]|nr:hypothetical protein [Alphaproteobacteria bacterium]
MRKLLLGICGLALGIHVAQAGQTESPFTILVGEPSWLAESQSIAKALDHENALRVLPIISTGSLAALQDMEQFSLINAVMVTTDAAAYVRAQNIGAPEGEHLTYITAIKPLPILLVARKGINNVTGLAGKKIATGPADSASFAAGELLLGGMEVPFLRVPAAQEKAIDALAQGKADAALVVGTPANLERLGAANFRLLPMVLPPQLQGTYQPLKLTAREAPGLLNASQQVDGVSTELVLAVDDRSTKPDQVKLLKAFESELFSQLQAAPTSPLHDEVAGWQREATAAAIIKSLPATIIPTGATP